MVRVLRALIGAAALALAALVLFSLLNSWLPSADSVGHFRHYLVFALLAVSAVLAALRAWRVAAFGGLVVVAGLVSMPQLLPAGPAPEGGGEPLVLVQSNLYYGNGAAPGFAAFASGADVLTLEEVSPEHDGLMAALAARFGAVQRCPRSPFLDVAVLSRLPALAQGCGEGLAWMRIATAGGEVTIAALHLHWPWPYNQRAQVRRLRTTLGKLPRPVILAGDFNAAPWSASAADVAAATDTTIVTGLRTSIYRRMPWIGVTLGLPLDHVLLPEGAVLREIGLGPPVGSDHLPVRAVIGLP